MAKYIDGYVLIVHKNKVAEYKKMAEEGRDFWMRAGALAYYECIGDDLKTDDMGGMKSLGFTQLTKAKPDETVWFSFVIYKSKKHRDEVNKKVMAEMDEKYKDVTNFEMPFEMSRMSKGGFSVEVEG